ncbi:MAG: peptidoglycan-binding domain-containing protein [Caldicoprobacter sp.]|uniref:peptidoglycan-binding domain-containing protein n=1 Tax=Caldicoprobacter sp. TaxID=2004500 RepID=UPI00396D77A2
MKVKANLFILTLMVCLLLCVPARGEGTPAGVGTNQGDLPVTADNEVLKVKCTGQKVVDLQMRLRDLGYFNYKVTGYYGTATADAVRLFQEVNGLKVDGTVGPETRRVLYSPNAKRYTVYPSTAASYLPASRGGRTSMGVLVEWFSKGQYLFPRGAVAKVIDLYTGRSFYMKRTGGSNHADSEPLTAKDAQTIREIWGGWSWERRPVIVEIGGVRVAASMHGMPHAYDTIPNNGMQGHVCIHFYKSRTHIHNRQDPDHQAAVMRAAGR